MKDNEIAELNSYVKGTESPIQALGGDSKKEEHKFLFIEHVEGDDGDYIWHFSNLRRERPFPEDLTPILQVIVTYLDKVMPSKTKVDVYPPPADWEKKVISVVARGITKEWTFDEEDMQKHLPKIGELVSNLIEDDYQRKRSRR